MARHFNNSSVRHLGHKRQGARRQWLDQIVADASKLGMVTRTLRTGGITVPDLTAFAKSKGLAITWDGNTCHIARPKAA
jgi:hypothetical protein